MQSSVLTSGFTKHYITVIWCYINEFRAYLQGMGGGGGEILEGDGGSFHLGVGAQRSFTPPHS